MEKKVNIVIRGVMGQGEILSKLGKNKAGEPSIIFYSQQKPTGWFDQLKLNVKKLFGSVRSGTEVAKEYSKELSSAVANNVKRGGNPVTPSFSTPQALQAYLNSINDGLYTLEDTGVTTTVNVEIEAVPPHDDTFDKRLWTDNDRKILDSLKTPDNDSKYQPYRGSSPQLRDSSTIATAETEKITGS
jgi:hypothetical protein